jgi:hypothetical protein
VEVQAATSQKVMEARMSLNQEEMEASRDDMKA